MVLLARYATPTQFRFQQIDVSTELYNKEGRYQASEYRFPFPDDSFDFVMLGSVFTHMLPEDVANYPLGDSSRHGSGEPLHDLLLSPE